MRVERRHLAGAAAVGLIGLAALGSGWVSASRPRSAELTADRTLVVMTSRDSGAGSLREAIFAAASSPQRVRIEIRPRRIELRSPLPAVVNPRGVVLDCAGAECWIDARPLPEVPALDIAAPNTVVNRISVEHSAAQGILVRAPGVRLWAVELADCAEGVRLSGSADAVVEDSRFRENGSGIVVADRSTAAIRRNRFTGHDRAAVWVVSEEFREGAGAPVQVLSNTFERDRSGVVSINVPVVIQRNEFRRERESAVYLMGRGAVVRQNRVREGGLIGIFADSTDGPVIDGNEVDRNLIGVMIRSSRKSLTRNNRIHSNGYGVAVVFGDGGSSNLLSENLITTQSYDGFYLVGASPILRNNVALRNQKAALRILDFVPLQGPTVLAVPLLTANRFEANLLNEPVKGLYREPEVRR